MTTSPLTTPPGRSRPGARGTTYTGEPLIDARTIMLGIVAGDAANRTVCPFTGRTGGSTPSGTPPNVPDQAPAASTTTGAASRPPDANSTPVTVSCFTVRALTLSVTNCQPDV